MWPRMASNAATFVFRTLLVWLSNVNFVGDNVVTQCQRYSPKIGTGEMASRVGFAPQARASEFESWNPCFFVFVFFKGWTGSVYGCL